MSNQTIVTNIQSHLRELKGKLATLKAQEKRVKQDIRRYERGLKLFAERTGEVARHEPPGAG